MKSLFGNQVNFYKELIEICPDGIIGVERNGTISIFNPTAEALTGRQQDQVLGKLSITEIYSSPQEARQIKKMVYDRRFGGSGRLEGFETQIKDINNRLIPIRLSAALLFHDQKEVGSVGFFHDMSERRDFEKRLHELSITDGLTDLYNQRYFHSTASKEVARAHRHGRPLSLICIDLDHFKQCNDLMGHQEGDNVLRQVSSILKSNLRKSDLAFRYGGDEFMVLLPETGLKAAISVVEKIQQAFALKYPSRQSLSFPRVTMSAGIAQLKEGETGKILLKRADMSMYEAKRSGGDTIRWTD